MQRPNDPLPEYRYQPLRDPNAIRLLTLRHDDETAENVACDLFEVAPDRKHEIQYEALSWTWSLAELRKPIRIDENGIGYYLHISTNLFEALKALRDPRKSRTLWIDAICVNQSSPDEKNHQIPMMPQIYGGATRVCIWLGVASEDSNDAIDFMEKIIDDIWSFDKLCGNTNEAFHWKALLTLIMRPWFSRRWIVQEIALAEDGIIYCGRKTISWRKFSDAVSLFVEVETATHRLSEIMKKEEIIRHIPDFFEDVAALSATQLIETTNNLFRRLPDSQKDKLLSLEYLVSRLSIFNTTEPSDVIYALLAIAKNTSPVAFTRRDQKTPAQRRAQTLGQQISSRPFYVNYGQPFIDTCRDFVEFSIRQSEESRALDILCRPWAPKVEGGSGRRSAVARTAAWTVRDQPYELPSWIRGVKDAAFEVYTAPYGEKIGRINADPLVGLPSFGQRNYSAAETKKVDFEKLRFEKRSKHYSMFVEGFVYDKVGKVQDVAVKGSLPQTWLKAGGWMNIDQRNCGGLWLLIGGRKGRIL